ncbi:MAG TPA: glycosyltransferase [Solirubrobacterales bacterium]|nr:glycosyltransferase [Solirubrobacterales bacterium]
MPEGTLERGTAVELTDATMPRAAKLSSELAILVTEREPSALGLAESSIEVDVVDVGEIEGVELTDLKSLLREKLAPLDRETREAILAKLADLASLQGRASFELSASLYGIREVLRERLPRCVVSEEHPAGLAVERILAVDDTSFWVNGWAHDEDGRCEVVLVSPEGGRVDITPVAFRAPRPDVVQFYAGRGADRTADHGFTAYFQVPAPSALAAGWVAELHTGDGLQVEVQCPAVMHDANAVRSAILGELGSRGRIGGPLAEDHGRHALTRLQERIVAESKVESVDIYGVPPRKAAVSVVVPLYKRLDFLEHQLLHFSRDPELSGADVVYVLDSTEQTEELQRLARELFALHRVPFRVVNLTAGAGYAAANGHGIALARAKRLLLLNSDVIPDRPGWLGEMIEFHDRVDGIGALAPKLLYEDDSLQHAGLYFHRPAASEVWENAHCFKGMHRSFGPANVARAVPAVTGACMLIERKDYEEVGGLPLHYVQGDYEDSELCLRLAAAGGSNWYLPTVELYHLEGQSYLPGVRRVPSEYNMWLHTALLGERIEQTMAEFDPNATVAGAGD